LFAVAGAQAADLPVKAKAVEYVKVCSLYGVGYYYIPGTDTCIKIGGYVRYEAYHNATEGLYPNWSSYGAQGQFTRATNTFAQQARFRLTADVRTQTEYGTLRSYFSMGINWMNRQNEPYYGDAIVQATGQSTQQTVFTGAAPGVAAQGVGFTGNFTFALERAFIQFAGFTIGRADTMFAFYNGAAYGLVPMFMDGSSGPSGLNIFAYTWQFGNGLSATLSAEDSFARSRGVFDLSAGGLGAGSSVDTQGQQIPDIVANLRVDQGWGSAQIMGSLHQNGGRYFNNVSVSTVPGTAPVGCPNALQGAGAGTAVAQANTTTCGHPDEKWGWAVGAGLTLKMPWDAKDTLSGVIAYAEGHTGAVAFGGANNFLHRDNGFGIGIISDGLYRSPGVISGYDGSIQLTKSWGGTVAFEHYWTPSLRTSWVFGYLSIEHNDTAKALIARGADSGGTQGFAGCRVTNFNNNGVNPAGGLKNFSGNCDPDWSVWRLASRTMWNPVANLDVGLEVAYTKLNTAFGGSTINYNQTASYANGLANGFYAIDDQNVWSATLRVQRSFWP
jgi:hypothetical protein